MSPFAMADATRLERYVGDFGVARMMHHVPYPYPPGAARWWIALHPLSFLPNAPLALAVRAAHESLVGGIALHRDATKGRGEVSGWIARPFWGYGFATEALALMLAEAFGRFGLERVEGRRLASNPTSGQVMEKAGLRREGRAWGVKDGHSVELVLYAIGRDEFRRLERSF